MVDTARRTYGAVVASLGWRTPVQASVTQYDLAALVPVYLFAVGLGLAVTAGVYLQSRDAPPRDRRRRVGVSLLCTLLALFPLPLVFLLRR